MTQLPIYTEEHELFRRTIREFVAVEITPFVNEWDEGEEFPRELYQKVGAIGLFGTGFDEQFGGLGEHDAILLSIISEEFAKCGAGGVAASLFSNYIAAPPIQLGGSEEVKAEILPGMLSGDLICALAITEPGAGSDVAGLTTTARRDGDHYVVNGQKTYITSGMRADYLTTAWPRWAGGVRTRPPSISTSAVCRPNTYSASRMRDSTSSWRTSTSSASK